MSSSENNQKIANLSRRQFFKQMGALSGCLLIGVSLPSQAIAGLAGNSANSSFEPNVFIKIAADGLVSIISHRSEMGQGIKSSLPLLIADELEADWNRVNVVQATADEKYGSQNTDGSRSVRKNYHRLRVAGATARTMLAQAAAQIWQIDVKHCRVYNHKITNQKTNAQLDFGDCVAIATGLPMPDKSKVTLKDDTQLRYVGKDDIELVEGKEMVTGKAIYGTDVELPGMTYAVIARPPVVFGTIKSLDDSAAKKVPGVRKIIRLDSPTPPAMFKPLGGVAVIADNTWAATTARDKLKIEWDHGAHHNFSSEQHRKAFAKSLDEASHVQRKKGNWQHAQQQAAKTIEAEYYTAGLSHSMMEPPAAVARFTGDKLDIWASTQTPQSAKQNVVGQLGLKPENVTVNVTYLGGGFGRKSKPDYVVEAAILARESGLPVKLVWTREDEIRHGYYHSPSLQRLKASIDSKGKTTGWLHQMVMHPIGSTFNPAADKPGFENDLGCADVMYNIDNIQIENGQTPTSQRIGWLRAVANISNVFASASFIDELAHAKKQDPVEHLLEMLGPDRHIDFAAEGYKYGNYGESASEYPVDTKRLKDVIKLAAKKANWGRKLPHGHGLGIAAHRSFCSYIATIVEVSMTGNRAKIVRVDSAIDCGKVVNPDRVHSQMEGSAIFSATLALYGEIDLEQGQVKQGNFDDYPLARIQEVGPTHIHLVESDEKPTGVGEPGVPPFAPALANAIYAASGKRYRNLPIKEVVA